MLTVLDFDRRRDDRIGDFWGQYADVAIGCRSRRLATRQRRPQFRRVTELMEGDIEILLTSKRGHPVKGPCRELSGAQTVGVNTSAWHTGLQWLYDGMSMTKSSSVLN